ncbi:heterokaryon incompatibility protein-domain-containing protein [Xylaria arbuscula]|nr:heterokaryon incompatibility protein-domain-containing protein [Xylaria arbuscula]
MSNQDYDEPETGQLCCHCQDLIIDDKAWGGYTTKKPTEPKFLIFDEGDSHRHFKTKYFFEDHYPSLTKLAESALNGCLCCAQIRESVLGANLEPPEGTVRAILMASYLWKIQGNDSYLEQVFPERGLSAFLLQVNFMPLRSQDRDVEPLSRPIMTFDIDSSAAPCVEWLRLETSPETNAMNPKNIAWIKDRLYQFEQKESSLGIRRDNSFLSTRLIDLGDDGQPDQPPRLVLASDLRTPGLCHNIEYAALSYCWGTPAEAASQFRTTHDTLQHHLTRINIPYTTPLITDAAQVCKALSIRYIWIDAICIIQDSKMDWENEASQMCNVYRNSALTICSLSSNSCSQGFLRDRTRGINIPFHSRVNPNIAGYFTLRYSIPTLTSMFSLGCTETEDQAEALWATRAWMFQEFHLSRVMLQFGKRKIHIVTGKDIISEGGTEGDTPLGLPAVSFLEMCRADAVEGSRKLEYEIVYNHWMGLASTYCMRDITYPSDKLPALSGLAAYFKGLLAPDDRYLAGIWLKDLHRQLFWMVPKNDRPTFNQLLSGYRVSKPQSQFIAPSWSWATQTRRFENSHRYFHTNGSYADYRPEYVSVEPHIHQSGTGVNLYGQIDSACLIIASRIKRVPSQPKRIHDDAFIDPLWQIKDSEGKYLADSNIDWKEGDDDPDWELDLLLLGSCVEDSQHGPFGRNRRYAWGLIICRATADEDEPVNTRKYYRVGIFYSKPKDEGGVGIFADCDIKTICLI